MINKDFKNRQNDPISIFVVYLRSNFANDFHQVHQLTKVGNTELNTESPAIFNQELSGIVCYLFH
jgi:fumarate hydratase class II